MAVSRSTAILLCVLKLMCSWLSIFPRKYGLREGLLLVSSYLDYLYSQPHQCSVTQRPILLWSQVRSRIPREWHTQNRYAVIISLVPTFIPPIDVEAFARPHRGSPPKLRARPSVALPRTLSSL